VTHPDLAPLAHLVGRWHGRGRGAYPTIDSFEYDEVVQFEAPPKPFLAYSQRTSDPASGAPLHAETGYVRLVGGLPELVIAQPTGLVEVLAGTLQDGRLVLDSTAVSATPSASVHRVTAVRRILEVQDGLMRYELHMAAVGHELQLHLEAELHRS
jgi:hypothetical protein